MAATEREEIATMRREHREMHAFIQRTMNETFELDQQIVIDILRENFDDEPEHHPMVQNGNGNYDDTDRAVRRALKTILLLYARLPPNIENIQN